MKDTELKLEEIEVSPTLGGVGEGRVHKFRPNVMQLLPSSREFYTLSCVLGLTEFNEGEEHPIVKNVISPDFRCSTIVLVLQGHFFFTHVNPPPRFF